MNVLEFNKKYLMGRPSQDFGGWVMGEQSVNPYVIPKIVCNDGYAVSLQASRTHYATPRNNQGPWFQVELGFPTEGDNRLVEYMDASTEDPDQIPDPTANVYGYVPLDIVLEVFESHGGIDEDATLHWSHELPKRLT